jgi:hypothetical protein
MTNRLFTSAMTLTLATATAIVGGSGIALANTPDYPGATWVAASPANYTPANRPHDYPVDMIIIHDTEGSFAGAVSIFQNPASMVSAHYVVSKTGQVDQMVQEHDIAWHAGNWDYNTRAIGIEHEGYAWTPNTYTSTEYQASAHIAASICSRWGVPMDRNHVIGHNQVPDPNNPALSGGSDHHTDPGPYWDWSYYMSVASSYANALPSPPHMVLSASAAPGNRSASLTWPAARTCHVPISLYHITGQPGNIALDVAGNATTAVVTGLQNGVSYSFTITAVNTDGQDSLTTNSVVPFTTPDAPGSVAATPGDRTAAVTWTAPNDEGRPIVGYQITPYANGHALPTLVYNRTFTTEVVSGLTDGVTYTFVIAAINQGGAGTASLPTNAVTPLSTLHPIASQAPPTTPAPSRTGAAPSSPAPSPQPR